MWLVGWSDGLPPTRLVVRGLQPDLFDVRPNLLRSRVCEERLARSIGKPDPHGSASSTVRAAGVRSDKCVLGLFPFADIHDRTEEMGKLSLMIADSVASYVRPDDCAILLEHTQFIVGNCHFLR